MKVEIPIMSELEADQFDDDLTPKPRTLELSNTRSSNSIGD
jgi:hypothetical protein